MKVLDLFSGIGGFSLAAHWLGWQTVAFVEKEKFCQKVLAKNFPRVPIYGDIFDFDGTQFRGSVDLVCGGFPCQPFSENGKRKGKDDSRYLWPQMHRVIGEVRPTYVVAENVSGSWLILDEVCADMESLGYETEPCSLEAASIGADHLRERYWFISYSKSIGNSQRSQPHSRAEDAGWPDVIYQRARGLASTDAGQAKSSICRIADDVPNRVDRLKALGNAVVPALVYEIFRAIEAADNSIARADGNSD